MIISNYKYQQIRKAINSGSNQYRINGKTGTAARYTDSPNTLYYVIDDLDAQTTNHYPVDSVSKTTQAKWDKLAQQ